MNARRLSVGLAALVLIAGGAVYAYGQSQKPFLDLGVAYAARVVCGCRHIGNRSLADCKKDFEPGMEPIRLSENVAAKSVTASVLFFTSRTATFDPVLGCQPEAFRD